MVYHFCKLILYFRTLDSIDYVVIKWPLICFCRGWTLPLCIDHNLWLNFTIPRKSLYWRFFWSQSHDRFHFFRLVMETVAIVPLVLLFMCGYTRNYGTGLRDFTFDESCTWYTVSTVEITLREPVIRSFLLYRCFVVHPIVFQWLLGWFDHWLVWWVYKCETSFDGFESSPKVYIMCRSRFEKSLVSGISSCVMDWNSLPGLVFSHKVSFWCTNQQ
jgi:hypothetical protein